MCQHWVSAYTSRVCVIVNGTKVSFVSLTITHTLWWASLNTDTDLHQQESLSFGDRTPLWSLTTHILCWCRMCQHWVSAYTSRSPCRNGVTGNLCFINYYTYSLVGITQHWHSPTPAGIPVVWRQDTFVSLTITHTLWWASLNTDTVLHQQESLSFGDRTPLFHELLHILSGGHHSTVTQSYTSRNPCRLETGHLCFLLLHILSGGHHSTLTQSYTSRNPCRLETGHLCLMNKRQGFSAGGHRNSVSVTCPPESMS